MNLLPPAGPARTRQLGLLGVLLIAAVYAVSRVWTDAPTSLSVPASNSQMPAAPIAGGPAMLPQPLMLEKLEPAPAAPGTTRDPFRFGAREAPAAARPPAFVPPPGASTPPPVPPTPGVPPIPLKFIGRVVLPEQSVVAVLADDRGSVLQGMEGQVVDGRYRIVRIGQEALVIEHVDGTGRTTLPLRGS
jgi:hypothetical protein